MLNIHDGASTQFANGNHHHMTAVWRVRTGRGHVDIKLITMHGKGVYDGYGKLPKSIADLLGQHGVFIEPGTRGFVLALADRHPTPSSCKTSMTDYWKADYFLTATSTRASSRAPVCPTRVALRARARCTWQLVSAGTMRKLCATGRCRCATTSTLVHRAVSSSSRTA